MSDELVTVALRDDSRQIVWFEADPEEISPWTGFVDQATLSRWRRIESEYSAYQAELDALQDEWSRAKFNREHPVD